MNKLTTKRLKIETLLKLKEILDRMIVNDYKGLKSKYSLADLEDVKKKEEQLKIVKEKIQEANLKKHKDGNTNAYCIYHLTSLIREKNALTTMLYSIRKIEQTSRDTVKKQIKQLATDILTTQDKLSTFNSSHTIKVKVDLNISIVKEFVE